MKIKLDSEAPKGEVTTHTGGGGDARQCDEELEEQEAFEQFVIETENGGKTTASLW